ncbi:hypothetical protein Salat_1186500 [Sesamum alatum]|uniref:Uncharacterized protein n=1 Tax=Sesamum alatum TaxID=300844 RepID=A0AAE1YFE6_9LAMI|nr:hypothetical protein Salat_1186500 [Sesamum alatum]
MPARPLGEPSSSPSLMDEPCRWSIRKAVERSCHLLDEPSSESEDSSDEEEEVAYSSLGAPDPFATPTPTPSPFQRPQEELDLIMETAMEALRNPPAPSEGIPVKESAEENAVSPKPTLVVPFLEEQPDFGRRSVWLGVYFTAI